MDLSSYLRKYSRYLLIIFNFLFVLTGVIILSVGLTVKAYYHEFGTFLNSKYIYASDFLIIIGVVIFVIAFFGCCGALKENACMTMTFSTLLIIIFILEVTVGIGGILLKYKAKGYLEDTLLNTMQRYNKSGGEVTELWDTMQEQFHCCGVYNYTDWENSTITNSTEGIIPISCCDVPPGTVGVMYCNRTSEKLHKVGCVDAFGDYIEGHAMSIELVGINLAIIQLLGILLSCYLSKQIKNGYETV